MEKTNYAVEDFYAFKIKTMWGYFKGQHFAFKMICCYLFMEFVRPQSIFPVLDVIPWTKLFILGALLGVFVDKSVKWTSSFANFFMILFSLLIISATYITPIYADEAKLHFMDFFSWIIIYFLIINIVNTRERFYIFILIFLVTAAKIAIGTSKSWALRGFSFTSWGLSGPKGFFQNSGELAILMLTLFPLAFYVYQALKNRVGKWERWFLLVCWVCPILTILGASSRGAQVALVLQLAFMFRKSVFKFKPLIGVIVLSAALFYLLPQEQKDRFSNSGTDNTSMQRQLYWEHGWQMMKDYPFTGVGFFNFGPYYEAHYPEDTIGGKGKAELPHNIFVQTGTDAGFVGAITFALIILSGMGMAFALARRKTASEPTRAIAAGIGVGIFGFLIAGQFVTVSYYPFLWIHMAFIVALKSIEDKATAALTTPSVNKS